MEKTKLYRRRIIPDETVYLKDDVIEYQDSDIIITSWRVLRPKVDFTNGRSCYFLSKGYKVSHFYDSVGRCIYTYCDIISATYNARENEYTVLDLLLDVVVYENGAVRVLDLKELADALDAGLITVDLAKTALRITDELLSVIYEGRFDSLTKFLSPSWLEEGNVGEPT